MYIMCDGARSSVTSRRSIETAQRIKLICGLSYTVLGGNNSSIFKNNSTSYGTSSQTLIFRLFRHGTSTVVCCQLSSTLVYNKSAMTECRAVRLRQLRLVFTACRNARIASAVLAMTFPSVCLSVRPSHAGIVSKRRHVARFKLHCHIAKRV